MESSSRTVERNYGKLLSLFELHGMSIHTIAAHKWKKDLNLSKDKSEAIKLAVKLLNEFESNGWKIVIHNKDGSIKDSIEFKNSEDGLAESFLIAYSQLKDKNGY